MDDIDKIANITSLSEGGHDQGKLVRTKTDLSKKIDRFVTAYKICLQS